MSGSWLTFDKRVKNDDGNSEIERIAEAEEKEEDDDEEKEEERKNEK